MEILNFKSDGLRITFTVLRLMIEHKVEVEKTEMGTRFTDINDFAEFWPDEEYDALESFIEGCSGWLHGNN